MSNITITNVDLGSVILKGAEFRDDLLFFTGAGTVVEGTILARKAVDDTVTPTADAGNTGEGTVTLATVFGAIIPMVGDYNLEVTEAVVNGGVFKLENPNGVLSSFGLILTVGAGAATIFTLSGLQFTVTDGDTDFVVGDKFSLAVTGNGKLVPYAVDGIGGAQIPKTVLSYDVIADGAGDESIRSIISGCVRTQRLIIDNDGDGSNITDAILDQLRDFSITPIDVGELSQLDNQ